MENNDLREELGRKNTTFINARCFVTSLIIIVILMILSYVATLLIPCEGMPFWKWILSPVLVLGSDDKVTLLGVIFFLLIIGGVFNALTQFGVMRYMIDRIAAKYGEKKYRLMAVIMFFFMALGSLIGSFEEVVPMVPIVVALAVRLGWDSLTGLSMSLLSVACGFAAGIFNPFTIGIFQELVGLPMFSGAGLRTINFVLIYVLLFIFTKTHARKIEKKNGEKMSGEPNPEGAVRADEPSGKTVTFLRDPAKDKAGKLFAVIMAIGILLVMSSALITFLRDYTFVIISLMFLIAGLVSCFAAGMKGYAFGRSFKDGLVSMLPAVLMILMASSIKFTLSTAGVLDILVGKAVSFASGLPGFTIILFIYLVVLLMNFVIPSGSAKAIMLAPILVALAEPFGVSPQLVCMAFAFGDGFSNIIYPTNPALLISLGLADTSYSEWFRYSIVFQILNLILTSGLLLLGI